MLSEVAAEAGVSRPTLYRYFPSKEELLDAFATYEQDNFDAGMAAAVAGLRGNDRLDAALQFIVDYQASYSLSFMAEIEPEHVLSHIQRAIPLMHERIVKIFPGENADVAAATVVRVAVCHYLVKGNVAVSSSLNCASPPASTRTGPASCDRRRAYMRPRMRNATDLYI